MTVSSFRRDILVDWSINDGAALWVPREFLQTLLSPVSMLKVVPCEAGTLLLTSIAIFFSESYTHYQVYKGLVCVEKNLVF